MTEPYDAGEIATQIAAPIEPSMAASAWMRDDEDQPRPAPARSWRRWMWWGCYGLAWLAMLSMFIIAGLRIFDHDGTYLLMWFNAFTRYIYLPAYACLAWAAWQRRWLLAIASLPIIACHLTWIAPDFMRDTRFDTAASAAADGVPQPATTLRIMFANVHGDNEDPTGYLDEISQWDPDVVVLAEFFSWWHSTATLHPAFRNYPFGSGRQMPFVSDIAVFSKRPIENPQQHWTAGRLNLTFDIRVDGVPLRLFCLHAPRPISLPLHNYDRYWEKTIPQILGQPDPAVVVGDCNATQYSAVYQTLSADRFRSAHEDRGRGYASTWPNGEYPLPPIRIDQAFISPGVECVQIAEGEGRGSDHKPIILDVRIRPAAERTPGGTH